MISPGLDATAEAQRNKDKYILCLIILLSVRACQTRIDTFRKEYMTTLSLVTFHLPESTMDLPGLIDSFKQNTKLLSELSLINKVVLSIVAFLGLCIFVILTERIFEHRPYESRKLWIGRSARILGRKMPPVGIALPMRGNNAQAEESVI